jgi:hypothetical protein
MRDVTAKGDVLLLMASTGSSIDFNCDIERT